MEFAVVLLSSPTWPPWQQFESSSRMLLFLWQRLGNCSCRVRHYTWRESSVVILFSEWHCQSSVFPRAINSRWHQLLLQSASCAWVSQLRNAGVSGVGFFQDNGVTIERGSIPSKKRRLCWQFCPWRWKCQRILCGSGRCFVVSWSSSNWVMMAEISTVAKRGKVHVCYASSWCRGSLEKQVTWSWTTVRGSQRGQLNETGTNSNWAWENIEIRPSSAQSFLTEWRKIHHSGHWHFQTLLEISVEYGENRNQRGNSQLACIFVSSPWKCEIEDQSATKTYNKLVHFYCLQR